MNDRSFTIRFHPRLPPRNRRKPQQRPSIILRTGGEGVEHFRETERHSSDLPAHAFSHRPRQRLSGGGRILTLVDAGPKTDEAWESLKTQLRERGYSPSDIEQVVLTHHHIDHVGLLDYLREHGNFRLIGHPRNRPWILQDESFYRRWYRYMEELFHSGGVAESLIGPNIELHKLLQQFNCRTDLDGEIAEGDEVPGMPGWRVKETKGHAQSHISLYREADERTDDRRRSSDRARILQCINRTALSRGGRAGEAAP